MSAKTCAKQITPTDRVMCRVNSKTVMVPENCLDITVMKYGGRYWLALLQLMVKGWLCASCKCARHSMGIRE